MRDIKPSALLTRILKDGNPLSLGLSAGAGLGLWAIAFPDAMAAGPVHERLAAHWLLWWVRGLPWANHLLALLLFIAFGLLARFIAVRFKLVQSRGWMPMLLSLGLLAAVPGIFVRTDLLLAVLLSQAAVFQLLIAYKEDSANGRLFHAGMAAMAAALCYGPSLPLVAMALFGVFVLRPGAWREWLMPLAGALMLLVFPLLFHIWAESPVQAMRQMLLSAFPMPAQSGALGLGKGLLAGLVALSLPSLSSELALGTLRTRNGLLIMVGLAVVAALATLVFGTPWDEAVALAAFPMAVAVCGMVEKVQRWWLADLLLALFAAGVVLAQ